MTEGDDTHPNAELVLKGIDAEIKRLVDEQRAPGWTNWAVLAGIGTLLWAIAGLEHVAYSRSLLTLILAMSLAVDVIVQVKHATRYKHAPLVGFRTAREMGAHTRLLYAMSTARSLVIIGATGWLTGGYLSGVSLFVTIAYGLATVASVTAIAMSATDFPIGPAHSTKAVAIVVNGIPAIGLAALVIAATFLAAEAFADWRADMFGPDDLRFAGGIVAIIYLISKIVLDHPTYVIDALVAVRRNLAFGKIDASAAVSQAEVALTGARLSTFLQDDIDKYRRLLDTGRAECQEAVRKFEGLSASIPVSDTFTDGQVAVIRSVRDACNSHFARAGAAITEADGAIDEIIRRIERAPMSEKVEIGTELRAMLHAFKAEHQRAGDGFLALKPLFDAAGNGKQDPTHSN